MKVYYVYRSRLIIFLLITVLFLPSVWAQTNPITLTPTFENVIPASPNASAITKPGNIQVNQSTGIPQVGIPIYTWPGGNFGISMTISLDYHAGGIKVDEMASTVGLGWSLNAGGVITRTVRGVYDELPGDGFLYRSMPSNNTEGNGSGDTPHAERLFYRMNSGLIDTQNDIFNFNFNGRSGSFVLGKNNDILLLDQSRLKIEKFITEVNNKPVISKFIITDEMGYQYSFEDYEITTTSKYGYQGNHTSSWFLTKVFNPAGTDYIQIEYDNTLLSNHQISYSQTIALPVTNDGLGLSAYMGGPSSVDIKGKRIKKITFPDDNTVSFLYNPTIRQDVPTGSSDNLLQKIILSKGGMSYGFLLAQDYSLGGRATLQSVQQFGSTESNTLKPYLFEYVNSPALPQRFNNNKDHWGYYNNNPSNDLIPHEYFRAPGGQYPPFREFLGGNRDTDPERVKAGSLTKITYPTGGYTVFEMEANTAKDVWLNQNETVTVQTPPFTDRSTSSGVSSSINPSATVPFVFQGENNTSTDFTIKGNPSATACTSSGCGIKFEFYNPSNQLLVTKILPFPSGDINQQTLSFSITNLIKGATYTVKCYTLNLSGYDDYVEIGWREINAGSSSQIVLSHVQRYVGGIRAKKITDYLPNTTPATVREYQYVLEDGTTSSGALGYRPVYTYLADYDYKYDETSNEAPAYFTGYGYIIRTSSSVNDLPVINGSPVTYKRIIEKNGQNGVYIGKTVRTFTSFADQPPTLLENFPSTPVEYADWNYGLLKSEEIYDANNTLLKKTENTYNSVTDNYSSNPTRVENFRSISIAPVRFLWPKVPQGTPLVYHIDPKQDPYYFLMSSFTPIAGRSELIQSTLTDYSSNNLTTAVTTTNTYDPIYYYLKQSSIVNSKNVELKTQYNYPNDMVVAGEDVVVYNGMLSKNIIKPVISEILFTGTTQTFLRKTKYRNWSGMLYAPETVITKTLAFAEETRLRYMQYDTHGAPVSLQKENGPPMTYIWGYGGNHLVAQLSNADYTTVTNALGGASTIEAFRNTRNPSSINVDNFLSPLLSNAGLVKGQIVRFKHNTLSGITSITDTKGETTTYEYDSFQRLMNVKDKDGNIVKHMDYH
ncbi:RHS repeat protein, partial [Mucilaginibacter sp. HC2]|uniref:RHS repeat domain-containing protein n=1 Tax=Mucilaginibacter inviolabilis TaxID=2714892 RepID=UPI00140BCED7